MTIHEQINADLVSAMKSKDRDTLEILRVVKGEFGREGKDLPDEKSLPIIRKMVENAKELGNDGEVEILENYLPKKLSEEDTRKIIEHLILGNNYSGMKDMGVVMGLLKPMTTSGEMDGKFVSGVVREMLTK